MAIHFKKCHNNNIPEKGMTAGYAAVLARGGILRPRVFLPLFISDPNFRCYFRAAYSGIDRIEIGDSEPIEEYESR